MADYYTLSELAEYTGCKRPTLYQYIHRGQLPAHKIGYFTVVTKKDAEAFKKRLRPLRMRGGEIMVYQS